MPGGTDSAAPPGTRFSASSLFGVGGGGLRGGNFFPWDISRFEFVQNFPHDFQAAVRNKPASKFSKMSCRTVARACGDGVRWNLWVAGLIFRWHKSVMPFHKT